MEYLYFCPKHGRNIMDSSNICPKCGKEMIQSDITWEELRSYMNSTDEEEKHYPYFIEKSFKTDLNKIVAELRSGKKGKVENALKLLVWRPERDDFIEDAVKWIRETISLKKTVTFFLSRCSYDRVLPYLDFADYNCENENSIKLFMPIFLEHYKQQKPLPCEKCRKDASNLFIKIKTEKKVVSAVRHVGYITQQLQYTGIAIPHAYCDECALKKANKEKRLKDLTDEEKIRGFMNLNWDQNIRTCNDEGVSALSCLDTVGFNYEYLISPEAEEEMVKNDADRAVLAGMIECALTVKEKLDGMR